MPKRPLGKAKRTRRKTPTLRVRSLANPPTSSRTAGQRFVKHVTTDKWYRSKMADRIPRKHKIVRALAHLTLGTVKVAGTAVAGLGVGAVEGGKFAAPHVKRHVRKRVEHRKWSPHRHPDFGQRKPGQRLVRHVTACLCGEVFTNAEALNEHHKKAHGSEKRSATPSENPTIHPGYTRRTAGQVRVRPAPHAPRGRHRATRTTAGHNRATTFVERHRTKITERGQAAMSSDSTITAVGKAWTEVGDTIPRGLQEIANIFAGLEKAASMKAEAIENLQKTLAVRLNIDPLVLHGLTGIATGADVEAGQWAMMINTLDTIYGELIALALQGVAIPSGEALRN